MSDTTPLPPSAPPDVRFAHEQDGYKVGLKARQLQMIAIGGAIGTGLFLGAGGRLNAAGPSLFLVFLICGIFAYLILRALGELREEATLAAEDSDQTTTGRGVEDDETR